MLLKQISLLSPSTEHWFGLQRSFGACKLIFIRRKINRKLHSKDTPILNRGKSNAWAYRQRWNTCGGDVHLRLNLTQSLKLYCKHTGLSLCCFTLLIQPYCTKLFHNVATDVLHYMYKFTADDFPQAALGVETPFFAAVESEGLTSSENGREMSNVKFAVWSHI